MKRRRGDLSLFEILREPTEAPKPEGDAARVSGPAADKAPETSGETDASHGSTTPAAPEAKPRLDVTPPSRSSRIAAARSEELPGARRSLPPLDPQLSSEQLTEETETEGGSATATWWNEPIAVRPPVLVLAAIGVFLVGLISYQSGASSADQRNARFGGFGDLDAAEWSRDTIQAHGMPKPEVRKIVDEDGPRADAAALGENTVLPVILVASKLGGDLEKDWKPVDALIMYLENMFPQLLVGVTLLDGEYAVYVGPFRTMQGARDVIPQVQSLKTWRGTKFRHSILFDLEFTPEDLRERPPL